VSWFDFEIEPFVVKFDLYFTSLIIFYYEIEFGITKDVQEELKWESSLINTEIGISVEEGIITLTGVVDSLSKKQAAADAVKQVSGVKIVINKIEVKDGELADITKSTFGNFENILSNTENSIKTSGA